MRPQKRMLILNVDQESIPVEGRELGTAGELKTQIQKRMLTSSDFEQSRAAWTSELAAGLTNYLYVRLKGRGMDNTPLEFKFLINPDLISVNHQTVDAESLTRGGPQVGLWGETTDVSISGSTAGQYFADSLVDGFGEYSLSYRNFMQLQAVYENNGYWFEGEAAGSKTNAAAHTLRQIQTQADVELGFGNFIWSGCFTEFSVEDTADTPYYNKFNLSFMVWKERYAKSSPWRSSISNDVSLGHSYEGRAALIDAEITRLWKPGALLPEATQLNALPTQEPATHASTNIFKEQLPVLQTLHDNNFRNPLEVAFKGKVNS